MFAKLFTFGRDYFLYFFEGVRDAGFDDLVDHGVFFPGEGSEDFLFDVEEVALDWERDVRVEADEGVDYSPEIKSLYATYIK